MSIALLTRYGLTTGPFSPSDIAGLHLWLDASDTTTITHDTGAVSQWDDKSDNGHDVTQGAGAAQPTTGAATLNSLNVLTFDGEQQLIRDSFTLARPYTLFAVARSTSNGRVISSRDSSLPQFLIARPTGAVAFFAGTAVINDGPTDMGDGGDWIVAAAQHVSTSSASWVLYDGAKTTGDPGSNTFNRLRVGARYNDLYLTGSIAEIIAYDAALNDDDVDDVRQYLSSKWGVALP